MGAAASNRRLLDNGPEPDRDREPPPDNEPDVDDPGVGIQHIVRSVTTDISHAALTFDDGPHPDLTPRVLDILDDHGVKATFMAMGHAASSHPELMAELVAAGHEIGHHSWRHKNLATIDDAEARSEIDNGVRLVEEAAGRPVRWFRPPRGRLSEAALRLVAQHGHDIVLWSVTRGRLDEESPRRVADHVVSETGPGDIICFHDGIGRATFDPGSDFEKELTDLRNTEIAALPAIIRGMRERGVEPRTVGDVVTRNGEILT